MNATWVCGGAALIAAAMLRIAQYRLAGLISVDGLPTIASIGDIVMALGLLVLAVGFRREDSVVGRRPLGVAAVCVFAVLPVLTTLVNSAQPGIDDAGYNLEAMRAAERAGALTFLANIILGLMSATLSAAAVAGARTVPSPWNWTPFWALALFVLLGGAIFFNMALVDVWWLHDIAPLMLLGWVILLLGLRRPVSDGEDTGVSGKQEHG